jgi:hypothetical protein
MTPEEKTFAETKERLGGRDPLMHGIFYSFVECPDCGLWLNVDTFWVSEPCPNDHGKFQLTRVKS